MLSNHMFKSYTNKNNSQVKNKIKQILNEVMHRKSQVMFCKDAECDSILVLTVKILMREEEKNFAWKVGLVNPLA